MAILGQYVLLNPNLGALADYLNLAAARRPDTLFFSALWVCLKAVMPVPTALRSNSCAP